MSSKPIDVVYEEIKTTNELKNDKQSLLSTLPTEILDIITENVNYDISLNTVLSGGFPHTCLPSKMYENREIMLTVCLFHPWYVNYLRPEFKNDKDFLTELEKRKTK